MGFVANLIYALSVIAITAVPLTFTAMPAA